MKSHSYIVKSSEGRRMITFYLPPPVQLHSSSFLLVLRCFSMKSLTLLSALIACVAAKWSGVPPPARVDYVTLTGQSAAAAADGVTVGSPFTEGVSGINLYANSFYQKEVEGIAIPALAGNQTLITIAKKVATVPSFFWLYVFTEIKKSCLFWDD